MERIKKFYRQSLFTFKALFGWTDPTAYALVKIATPILQLCFFCLLVRYVYNGEENIAHYVISNSIVLCSYNCIFGVGMIFVQERYFGTLRILVASPSNNIINFAGRSVIHIFDALFTVVLSLVAGSIVFGVDLHAINFLYFSAIILIGIFSASCFGLFIGTFGLVTDNLNLILNVVSMAFLVFTGANYPVANNHVMYAISRLLPLSRCIELSANLFDGIWNTESTILLMGEICIGLVFLVLGYIFMKFAEKIALRSGSIDMF